MKRPVVLLLCVLFACSAMYAQGMSGSFFDDYYSTAPSVNYGTKSVGIKASVQGADLVYQKWLGARCFFETDLGGEFGHGQCWDKIPSKDPWNGMGAKGSFTFNWIVSEELMPRLMSKGWALYFGAGAALGYVQDIVKFSHEEIDEYASLLANPESLGLVAMAGKNQKAMGLMAGLVFHAGIEYVFERIPFELSFDIQPIFGCHINQRIKAGGFTIDNSSKTGFYTYGLWGLVPSFSIRYCF